LELCAENTTGLPNSQGNSRQIGYARVSTQDQSLALQRNALRKAGCRQSYEEVISGARVERDLIRKRTQAGLAAARARGRVGGRPAGLSPAAEAAALAAETLYREGTLSTQAIAEKLNIAKSTLYVYLRHRGAPIGPSQQYPLPADSPQRLRARHLQVGGESLSSHTALGEHRVETLPPAVHALAALESPWTTARSTVLMAL
jgi:hypothetical protein